MRSNRSAAAMGFHTVMLTDDTPRGADHIAAVGLLHPMIAVIANSLMLKRTP